MENETITSNPIGELIRKAEQDYRAGNTYISKHVSFDMLGILNRIDAYHFSQHTSGSQDSKGRDKPFANAVVSAENIWYRATDIDRGQIKVRATKIKDVVDAFLATVHIQEWMRKENFGMFLNEWGRALSRYCSAVVKFVEKDGELHRMVVPWQTIICDSVDFENNPVIEVLDLTEAQLLKREGYDKTMVEALCNAKTIRKLPDGSPKDTKSDYIRIYEIHGELPLSRLTKDTPAYKESDEDEYVQQMHAVSFTVSNDDKGNTIYNDYTLAKGKEKNPYLLTHLIKEDSRTLGIGPVEYLFDTQWMMNHSVKSIKDQLDLASKLIFQTADGTFVGQNALTAIENGDILIHKENMPLTQIENNSHDIASSQNFANQWLTLGNKTVGISESMQGGTAPSGTAWRQVEALLQESHDLFALMRQNKGLYLEEMFRKFIIPFVKKQMDTTDEVAATLESHEITKIDSRFIKNQSTTLVNKIIVDKALNGEVVTPEDQSLMTDIASQGLENALSDQGNVRYFKPDDGLSWKEQFKDLEWELEVDTTGENVDKDAVTTLNTILNFFAKKNGQPLSPEEKFALDKLYMQSGTVSPLEISSIPRSRVSPMQPQMQPQTPPVPTPAGGQPQGGVD